jgi:uncharacterized protein YdeI (BOF family)
MVLRRVLTSCVSLLLGGAALSCEGVSFEREAVIREITKTFDLKTEDGTQLTLVGIRLLVNNEAFSAFQSLRGMTIRYHVVKDAAQDRWARTFAIVQVEWPEGAVILQEQVLRAGWAAFDRGATVPQACRALWATLEAPSTRFTAVRDAKALQAQIGHTLVAEGILVSVRVLDKQTYLNFGQDWSQSLSVMIPRSVWDAITPPLKAGDRVQVSGILEKGRGYLIKIRERDAILLK